MFGVADVGNCVYMVVCGVAAVVYIFLCVCVTIVILVMCVYYDVVVYLGHMTVRYLDIHTVSHDACCRIAVLIMFNAG